MWNDIRQNYASALAFALACPLLFLVPVVVEMAQHVVELLAGMYAGEAGARAAEADPLRLQFGFAKTLALLLPGYWFVRYLLFGNDAARARAVEWPAAGLYAVIFVLMAIQFWLSLFAPSLPELVGLAGGAATALSVVKAILLQVMAIYLIAWLVAWPMGNASIGPVRSFAIMHGSFWYAIGLFVAGFLPLMLLHYALAIAAVLWLPDWLDWAAMIIDAIVVGFLALTMAGANALAAQRAAARKGIALKPGA